MRVLVVGGGGREHALCWALSRSRIVDRLFAAPGNAGMAALATLVPLAATDVPGIAEFAEREGVDLTVVGPEAPLVAGLADEMAARGLPVFGPTRDAARVEGSKAWARWLCDQYGIPGPRSSVFDALPAALDYLDAMEPPYVVKADGLAAGKGVTVTEDRAAAVRALEDSMVRGVFGEAGRRVLLEEFLEGREVSALALTDGRSVAPLALARDYKRARDGDEGPNTGGMGAFSPVPFVDAETEERIVESVLRPTVAAMEKEGIRYRGVLYAGLMLTADGPKVLEFNCRFGDPEAQVVIPRCTTDVGALLLACVEENLGERGISWTDRACVGVVLASAGYPGRVDDGKPITGLDEAEGVEGALVFHAGTDVRGGRVLTAGGRVLTVAGLGADHDDARARAYEACARIAFEGMQYRSDIGAAAPQGAR